MSDMYAAHSEIREMRAANNELHQLNTQLQAQLKEATRMDKPCGDITGIFSDRWPYNWHACFYCKPHGVTAEASGKSWLGRKKAHAAYERAMLQVFRVGADHATTMASVQRRSEWGA